MTGESVPVKKEIGSYAYAGTAIEGKALSPSGSRKQLVLPDLN